MGLTPKQAIRAMESFRRGQPVAIMRAVRRGLRLMEGFAKTMFMVRGVFYPARPHQGQLEDPANPPPGPLKIRSGRLVRTVQSSKITFDGKRVRASLQAGSADVRYARLHELGGLAGRGHRALIRPRPYLGPAIEAGTDQLLEFVREEQRKLAIATLRGLIRPVTQ